MPKSIITKRVTMAETAWAEVARILREVGPLLYDLQLLYDLKFQATDVSDAIVALAGAEIIAETVNPAEEPNEIDSWAIDAGREGRSV